MAEKQPTISAPERWRPVPGFEGYEVSDLGRVRSIDRTITTRTGTRRYRGRMLTPAANRKGYLIVGLGQGKTRRVHRLVLEAFVGPCPEGYEGCHGDGDPTNNHLGNLRWSSSSENELDKVRHGTHYQTAKTHCPRSHQLVRPNLKPSAIKRGQRTCLACARARNYIRNRPGIKHDLQRIADGYYEKIMAEQAADDHLDADQAQYALFPL